MESGAFRCAGRGARFGLARRCVKGPRIRGVRFDAGTKPVRVERRRSRAATLAGMQLALLLLLAPNVQAPSPDLSTTLEPALIRLVEQRRLPGLALGVVANGRVLYARGFGETARGSGRPITTRSIFHMASVSKPFTATAVLQLVEAGKLDLDATLTSVLPYFRLADESSKAITLRQVLTHTSGFGDVRDYEWDKPQFDAGAAERYVRSLRDQHLLFEPGQGSRYSNMAFDTAGDVIAKASGMPFEDYLRVHVLEPLGMRSSSFLHAETPREQHTQGHSVGYSERIDQAPCPVYPYNRRHAPSSTLNSNVEDMCRWMLANLQRGELEGTRILGAEAYAALWSRDDDTPGVGLAWWLEVFEGHDIVLHTGADTGFNSYLGLLPDENVGVVVMANSDRAPLSEVAGAALLAALGREFRFSKPRISAEFAHVFENEGLERARERYFELEQSEPDAWRFGFEELERVCGALLERGRSDEAVGVATLNAELFDDLAAAHTRLGAALEAAGAATRARASFERALQLSPGDRAAQAGLAGLDAAPNPLEDGL